MSDDTRPIVSQKDWAALNLMTMIKENFLHEINGWSLALK